MYDWKKIGVVFLGVFSIDWELSTIVQSKKDDEDPLSNIGFAARVVAPSVRE